MYYFTADTHFSGCNIIQRENRPYRNFMEMDEDIISKFNSKMTKDDILWHVGDFFNYNADDIASWSRGIYLVRELDCKVCLVIGNNEERVIRDVFRGDFKYFRSWCVELGFLDVMRFTYLELDNRIYYLNHYPIESDPKAFNLFGHVHRSILSCRYGLNVGCDLNHFYPYSQKEIDALIRDKSKYTFRDINVLSMCENILSKEVK